MRRANTRGQHVMTSSTVAFILFIVVAIGILIIAARSSSISRSAGADSTCAVDVFQNSAKNEVTSFLKLPNLVFNYKLTCDAHAFYKRYSKLTSVSKTLIEKEIAQTAEQDDLLKYTESSFANDQDKVEYNLDKFYADQLKDCYRKIEDRKAFPPRFEISSAEIQGKEGWWEELKRWSKALIGIESAYAPPVYCIVCAKVYYEDELSTQMGGGDLNFDVSDYLLTHEDPLNPGKSLYEFMDAGRHTGVTQIDETQKYEYDLDDTQAVIYFRRYADIYSLGELGFDVISTIVTIPVGGKLGLTAVKYGVKFIGKGAVRSVLKYTTSKLVRKTAFKAGLAAGAAAPFAYTYMTDRSDADQAYPTAIFSQFDTDEAVPDEYGVAIVPYYELPYQCTFLANSYGDFKG